MQSVVLIKLEASPELGTSRPFAKVWWKMSWRSTSFRQAYGVILCRSLQQIWLAPLQRWIYKWTGCCVTVCMAMVAAALQQPPRNARSPSAIWGTSYIWSLTKIWTKYIESLNIFIWSVVCCLYIPGRTWTVKLCRSWCPLSACRSFRVNTAETLALQQLLSLLPGGKLKANWCDFTNPAAYPQFWPPSYACLHSCHVGYVSILMAQPLDLISVSCFLVSIDRVFNEVINLQ